MSDEQYMEPPSDDESILSNTVSVASTDAEDQQTGLATYLNPVLALTQEFNTEFPLYPTTVGSTKTKGWKSRLRGLCENLKIDPVTRKLVLGAKENMPLLEVEEKLTKFLLKTDELESAGFVIVREKRRALVKEILGMLKNIDKAKKRAKKKEKKIEEFCMSPIILGYPGFDNPETSEPESSECIPCGTTPSPLDVCSPFDVKQSLKTLDALALAFHSDFPAKDDDNVFLHSTIRSLSSTLQVDSDGHDLDPANPGNRGFLDMENKVAGILRQMESVQAKGHTVVRFRKQTVVREVQRAMTALREAKVEAIRRAKGDSSLKGE
ncbi:hypothetical protein HDU98_007581 [Podochytrium sp. JEL0797]|nr:hypothetical protein HDU98_007581 [Podochytrium sp. JEL0797]